MRSLRCVGECEREDAAGKSASFVCGSFVRIGLQIEPATKFLESIRYKTNGCGYAVAASEFIASRFQNINLTDLAGITDLESNLTSTLNANTEGRTHCIDIAVEAFRNALADYRRRTVEEFQGEDALICSCFGVSEREIVELMKDRGTSDIESVGKVCNAGTGCGSCQMLIQELIDAREQ